MNLPTPESLGRHATPKYQIVPKQLAKEEKDKKKADKGKAFRDAVWARDKGRSRATGKKLERTAISWDVCGEVDHVIDRSLAPERVYDVSNGILLSKRENRLKKLACPRAPELRMFSVEGPDDRGKEQVFTWRDKDGHVVKTKKG